MRMKKEINLFGGIVLFLAWVLFSCTDSTTEGTTTDIPVKDTLFGSISKTNFTGVYDTLGYTLLVNTISKEKYASVNFYNMTTDTLLRDSVCKGKEQGYMEMMENYYISKVPTKVKRKGKELTLSLSNGKTVELTNDNSDDEGYEVYQFISLDQNGYFIVAVYYMESYGYLLVNSANGKTMKTIGYPVFSPDKKQYVAGNYDMMAAFTFNGIDFMKVNNDEVSSLAKIDFGTWGPEEVKWKDDSTLYVKQKSQTGEEAKVENNFAAIRIRRKLGI